MTAARLAVNAVGSGGAVRNHRHRRHDESATPRSGGVSVNATAMAPGKTLTLLGSGAETVTNLAANIVATGLTGALTVSSTKTNALSITTGSGGTTINDTGMTGVLTVTGVGATTVTGLTGNLTATGESGALTVTTTGATQTVDRPAPAIFRSTTRRRALSDGQCSGAPIRRHGDADRRPALRP